MATTGHESELINVGGLKASLQKLKTDIIDGKVESSSVGAASGVASLDESGLVPSTQLPSYVDDVVELLAITDTAPATCAKGDLYFNTTTSKVVRATATDTWGTGPTTNTDPEKGKIYVNLTNDKSYRWGGSVMVEISSSDVTGIKVGASGTTITPSQGVITIPEYETGAQVHIAPTTAEVKSALNTVTTSQGKYLKDDGTWDTPPDTTYPTMGASGSSHAGGLVPDTPSTAGTSKFLREDGTWANQADVIFEGYLNPSDGNFYETKTPIVVEEEITGYNYSGLIEAKSHALYVELDTNREYRWTNPVIGYSEVGRSYSNAVASESGVGGSDGLMSATDKEKVDNIPAWSQQATKPSYAYSEIGYTVSTTSDNGNTAGAVTIDGTNPLTVLTLTGNVSSLSLASGKEPEAGHSAHVVLYSASACTVEIAHDATSRVCPKGDDISLSIDAGGYAEVDFLNADSKIFVRCV